MCSSLALAAQPTQQYNKVLLSPYYTATLTKNVVYNYNLTISVPDGITSVNSAIINFQMYVTSSPQSFILTVNNQSCRNPIYNALSSGFGMATFDCTNIITKAGKYELKLNSAKDSGGITGWLDLTYVNSPMGSLEVSGTDYTPGDLATIFLQLRDSQGLSINNGSCYVNIWWPLNSTNQHPYVVRNAPMMLAEGNEGMYYYDITVPEYLGVYMLSARCAYSYNYYWVYDRDDDINYPLAYLISGTWTGTPSVLNSEVDGLYYRCSGNPCQANFTFDVGSLSNITDINNYLYVSSQNARTITVAYWNGATFVNLANTLATTSTASGSEPYGYDEVLTNTVPLDSVIGGKITLRITTSGGVGAFFFNRFSLALLTSSSNIHDLRGSSEMNVRNIPNATATLVNNQTPSYVWNYTERNLTYYPETVTAEQIWNYTERNLTYYEDKTNYTLIEQIVMNIVDIYNGIQMRVFG